MSAGSDTYSPQLGLRDARAHPLFFANSAMN